MGTIVRIAYTGRYHRDIPKRTSKGVDRTAPTCHWGHPIGAIVHCFCGPCSELDKWIVCRSLVGPHGTQASYVYIREALLIQICTQFPENVIRVLIGYEAKIDFSCCPSRNDRLHALALMARRQPGNIAGGTKDRSLKIGSGEPAHEFFHAKGLADPILH